LAGRGSSTVAVSRLCKNKGTYSVVGLLQESPG
jgi:hypothetical protein